MNGTAQPTGDGERVVKALLVVAALVLAGTLAGVRLVDGANRASPYVLRRIASGLASPVYVTAPRTERDRLYVVLRSGAVRILARGRLQPRPFLDLRGDVSVSGEMGLLSIAFPPDYATTRRFYAIFNDVEGALRLVEYHVADGRADESSARVLVRIPHEDSPYHNGGQLAFGPDGWLYAGVGDGGYFREDGVRTRPDPRGNSQNTSVLLGKLFRLDVAEPDPQPVVVAYGLRNPWRFSFAPRSGDLVVADVGWNAVEEVNLLQRGSPLRNFGWSIYEGRQRRNPEHVQLNPAGRLTWPILTYETHRNGNCSITGGYVYRGRIARLRGRYVFGDYCSGRIWSTVIRNGRASRRRVEPYRVRALASFGEDANGELYAISLRGAIYRFARR
ncbi:MAG: PQQ-dependent sugar dehydrogenase [Thermoleophilia bacterium]|nr:PQQ-dependent sugar dehydrogenase [Thermoleophilia bacterium]